MVLSDDYDVDFALTFPVWLKVSGVDRQFRMLIL